jgi:O-antigen biosynthesis protein
MIDSVAVDPRAVFCALTPTCKTRLLFISHAWGGGIDRHIRDLIALVGDAADVLLLRGLGRGGLELQWHLAGQSQTSIRVGGFDASTLDLWADALRSVGFTRVHFHHVHGWSASILKLVKALDIAFDITLHDYAVMCPQYHLSDENGRYCGEPDESGCTSCLQMRPSAWGIGIVEWRSIFGDFLLDAQRVIAPSKDVATRISKHFPDLSVLVWPHPEVRAAALPISMKVAILGALSVVKGLRVVESVAAHAKQVAPEITFRLIGHSAEPLTSGITATGSYADVDLPRLIADERPDVIWFPAQVPETHSYTLTQALTSQCAIVASDFGALRERLLGVDRARLVAFDAIDSQWLAALRAAHTDAAGNSPIRDESVSSLGTAPSTYRSDYLSAFQSVVPPPLNLTALTRVLSSSPSHTPEPDRAIIDIFRIGAFGGHHESLNEVGNRLNALLADEVQVSGRRERNALHGQVDNLALQVDDLTLHTERLDLRLNILQGDYERVKNEGELSVENLSVAQENIAALQRDAAGAIKHIKHLETERQRMVASSSWKITRPLRVARRLVKSMPTVCAHVYRLAFHSPDGMARLLRLYRRGGLSAIAQRANREIRVVIPLSESSSVEANGLSEQPDAIQALRLQTSSNPTVSIIIPVYGQHLTTFTCLKSIAEHPPSEAYEVIITDDASPESASEALTLVQGVRFVRNASNLGFIGNVNAGAAAAAGQILVILNNDTVVTANAFDAMLKTFVQNDNVGIVGAKLLNRDGTLQEAGGIIWRDGSGWNYGRNQDRRDPRFNFVRDVDYCSGAALAISSTLFAEMGGFDTHYAPAYYEDTDLAFRVRDKGKRVLYQPHAEIFHIEGVSHGRDETSGIKVYQTINAKKFYERWQATLSTHRKNGDEPELEAHRGTRHNILIVEACMITPDQDSGSIRMLNLMRLLKEEGHHVTFVADNLEGTRRYAAQIELLGVEVVHGKWVGSVQRFLRERGSSLEAIIFCRHYIASQYVKSVRVAAPNARIIFDTVDLHFVRELREAELHADSSMLVAAHLTREKELAVIAKSDVTIVVSAFEKNLLKEIAPAAHVEIISNIHAVTPERPAYQERADILFIGGFRHPPNVDAIKWYASEVMPRLAVLLPGVVTRVVGSNMTREVQSLQTDNLRILGFVPDADPLLQSARVSIAPLRYGAGVKGKVNEAMNYGIPVVATACAVEGMHLVFGEEVMVADDPQDFALAIQQVYNNEILWKKLSLAGIANVRQYFSMEAALGGVRAMLDGR